MYAQAGTFTLSKWAEGTYCLGGSEEGLSFANTHDKYVEVDHIGRIKLTIGRSGQERLSFPTIEKLAYRSN